MRKRIGRLFALWLAAVLALTASGALAETRITVSGTGETRISADTAVITLGVSARSRDVQEAQRQVNEAIASIRAALTGLGVAGENINTDYMSIYAIYDYEGDVETVRAYNAGTTLAVQVTDMDLAGRVIDEAFGAGANTLNGIAFSASDTEAARAGSLRAAVADARAKAEVLAEAAGLKITGIEEITEGGAYSYDNAAGNFRAAQMDKGTGSAETVVQAARLVVSVTVNMTFIAE